MRFFLTSGLVVLTIGLCAQHSLIYDVPNTPEILQKNNVKEIHIREKQDEEMKITNKYFIRDGIAYEHVYYDPYDQSSGNVTEKSWLIPDSTGWISYVREIRDEDGKLITTTHRYTSHYSKTKKILFTEQKSFADYMTIHKIWFDTLNPEKEKREEVRILNEDTLFLIIDDFDGNIRNHIYKTKVMGKWTENERINSIFENGVLLEYYRYSFGKLVDTYNKFEFDKMDEKLGTDDEVEYGLPIPDPVTEIFYVDDFNVDKITEVKKSKAKYRLEVHYEQGKNSDPYYTFYENKSGLIHTRFGKDKKFYTEFLYVMGK